MNEKLTSGRKRNKRITKLSRTRRQRRKQHRRYWDAFCAQCYPTIVSYTRSLANGDAWESEDLAQATVLRVLKYSPDPNGISNPLSYLRRVAHNLWVDSLANFKPDSLDELLEADPNNSALRVPTDIATLLEDGEELIARLGPLTSELLTTLRMRLEGYSWEEIAAVLNEPVSRTKFRWYTFLKQVHARARRQRGNDQRRRPQDHGKSL
jgi:RNA polymerase sigma-70 factor (ECF subfamily)